MYNANAYKIYAGKIYLGNAIYYSTKNKIFRMLKVISGMYLSLNLSIQLKNKLLKTVDIKLFCFLAMIKIE